MSWTHNVQRLKPHHFVLIKCEVSGIKGDSDDG